MSARCNIEKCLALLLLKLLQLLQLLPDISSHMHFHSISIFHLLAVHIHVFQSVQLLLLLTNFGGGKINHEKCLAINNGLVIRFGFARNGIRRVGKWSRARQWRREKRSRRWL